MNDNRQLFVFGIFIGLIVGVLLVVSVKPSYKEGQIDALTGKIRYELVVNSDSTRTWKYINKD